MRIPDRIKIGATGVNILLSECVKLKGEDLLGLSRSSVGKIEIATTYDGEPCTEETITDTMLHEIIHIINQNFGIGLRERQVAGLAGALLAAIRDNDLDFRV